MTRERFSFRRLRSPGCMIVAAATAMLLLAGCQNLQAEFPAVQFPLPAATEAPTEAPTAAPTEATEPAPTEPEPTSPPAGNPDDITCKGSYTGTVVGLAEAKDQIVATAGEEELSNALLQIYYQMAVNSYKEAGHEFGPDFSQPLDAQIRDLDGNAITWQQYFLQQALDTWHSHAAMTVRSRSEVLPLEEAYGRNEKKHAENLKTRIYNLDLLYGYNADYRIDVNHQAYLDSLESRIAELAEVNGCKTPAALANDLAGIGTNDTYLLKYAQLLNEGYMFMTSLSYYIEPTEAEVEAYFAEHEAAYAEQGITKKGSLVNLRHILLVPEGATRDENGNLTAGSKAWNNCEDDAEALLKKWAGNRTEANFAELAFANSADTGSSVNGGLYTNLAKGQLTPELDEWCFDPDREAGDTAVIRTAEGCHVVYMCTPASIWYEQAEKDLIAEQLMKQISTTAAKYPMEVDYSAITLGWPGSEELVLTADDLLYPDIAHERFPVAPLYFQQDYPDTMYGNYSLVTYGCGVTTMSMLVSYMTDEEWTPPELCSLYGSYCSEKGTAHAMFTEVPTDRGFYCVDRVFNWDEAKKALEEGYMVVTLQREGFWTRGGHYLLLHNLLETEDGTKIQVRDSNLYNYKRLEGHTTGYFDLDTIPSNSRSYWIYQKKVTHLDSCVRCAQLTEDSHVPTGMFAEDYLCPKCAVAVNRRDAYLDGCTYRIAPEEIVIPEETVPDDHISDETLPEDYDHFGS